MDPPERIDPTSARRRLDVELLRRSLAESREHAKALIDARMVLVSGSVAQKAATQVHAGDAIEVREIGPKFVSRGGKKLAAAIAGFSLDVKAKRAIDAGSSTGGFTDCLLQSGAVEVVAIDVGTHQLHERLRNDDRVKVFEQTDIRTVALDTIGGQAPVVVADLSFISLRSVAESLLGLTRPGGDLVILVKPQFEAGRQAVSKGRGVIGDPEIWSEVLFAAQTTIRDAGGAMMGLMCSPIRGGAANAGNVEFLLHARPLRARVGNSLGDRSPLGDRAPLGDAASTQLIHDTVAAAVALVNSGTRR